MSILETPPQELRVFIISLERDVARRGKILRDISKSSGFAVQVVTAVAGDTLPDLAMLLLTRSERWVRNKGTIGCFLSHIRAWEAVSALDARFSMILEDDADVSCIDDLHGIDIPADAEFVFLNERMSANLEGGDLRVLPMRLAFACKDRDRTRPGNIDRNGFGTDGYLLSPAGAAKLLAACANDLCFGHVDGRLLRYVTPAEEFESLLPESWIKSIIRDHHDKTRLPKLGLLKGYCLSRPIIKHLTTESSRSKADRR